MGFWKDIQIEMDNDEKGSQIAEALGIQHIDLIVNKISYEISQKEGFCVVEFSEDTPIDFLDKIERLEEGRKVYLDFEFTDLYNDKYYEDQYNAIIGNKHFYLTFSTEINDLEKLLKLNIKEEKLKKIFFRQIFISIIGTLETFLSDTFINLIMENKFYLEKFVKSFPEFKKRTYKLSNIFDSHNRINDTVKKVLMDIIYHDLRKVQPMYEETFKIKFPKFWEVQKLVTIRHDLVHRNGKTKEGENILLNKDKVQEAIQTTLEYVKNIVEKLRQIKGFETRF